MIGDKKSDYLAAKKSNLKFIYINQKSFFNQIKNKIR
jgi:phosphoglycolate phosphatase-like HAD superfamily hydrolase